MRIEKLVNVRTNECLSCTLKLKPGGEVEHYKYQHYNLLKEIQRQVDDDTR